MTPAGGVLDVCCGPRSFYFDKQDSRVTYCDLHHRRKTLCDGRELVVEPDVVADFRDLPFADGAYSLVVFDPPHLTRGHGWQVDKYGVLGPDWRSDLAAGFRECLRVLAPGGTLVFKWHEYGVPLRDVLALCPARPVFGNRRPGQSKTHFIVFFKDAS